MTTLFTLIEPLPGEGGEAFAVIADDRGARYVFADESDDDGTGLDPARIKRLSEWADKKPTTAAQWIGVAAQGIGYTIIHNAVEAENMEDALDMAIAAIARTPPSVANPDRAPGVVQDDQPEPMTRSDLLAFQADAYYQWSTKYPEAAAGDVDDPEAELALMHLMTPPTDPDKPHAWLPIATTETDCGFCDLPADADIHSAGADTLTRGAN